jgi:ubiquilin
MLINPQLREVMERNPEIMQTMADPELMKRMVDVVRSPAMLQELMRGQEHLIGGLRVPAAGASSSADESAKTDQASSVAKTAGSSETGSSSGGELFNQAGVRSMLQQISQNPQLMTNMLQAPYVQCMLQSMSQNPLLVQQMLTSSPMFANNPVLQEMLPRTVPYFAQQLQNPEIQCMMSNPRALQAMLLIQQGMHELNAAMPTALRDDSVSTAADADAAAVDNVSGKTMDDYTKFMSCMLKMVSSADGSGDDSQTPEQKFALQLHQLSMMGFINRDANIEALSAVQGDVNSAINRLLQHS